MRLTDPSSCTLRQADLCTLARATWWRPCLKKTHSSRNMQGHTARVTAHIWRASLLCSQSASNINNHVTYIVWLITLSDIHHHTILSAEASSGSLANAPCSSAFLTPRNEWLFKRQMLAVSVQELHRERCSKWTWSLTGECLVVSRKGGRPKIFPWYLLSSSFQTTSVLAQGRCTGWAKQTSECLAELSWWWRWVIDSTDTSSP